MNNCFHCGQCNPKVPIKFDRKSFCCIGCKSVYEILNSKELNAYYEFNRTPGVRPEDRYYNQFDSLDTPEIFDKVVNFSENGITLVNFKIPVIHCTSCILVLESLKKINNSIIDSYVNFNKKTVQISFRNEQLKLSELAKFLTKLGYKPIISYERSDIQQENSNNQLLIKLSIAGFSFGNVMLFALPEYISDITDWWMNQYKDLFRYLMFLLSLPVVFYSSIDYYQSAISGIRNKVLNINVPISIGIIILFLRSTYESYYDISSGYFDTLCGLLFFMLIGKHFQQKTYQSLSFNRDYKSFYPISVTIVDFEKRQKNILLSDLKAGDRILIRNEEIIPADVILLHGNAQINNSFITGESDLIQKKKGDKIYAGGKQIGTLIECKVIKGVNQSYLTELWNHSTFKKKDESILNSLTTQVSKYFTATILLITFLSGIFWYFISEHDYSKMFQVICAILIVACPCSLALSSPFTMGNMMRILSQLQFYVKDSNTIEKMAKVNHLVFDKTGTISIANQMKVKFEGEELTEQQKLSIFLLVQNSNHPLSRNIAKYLGFQHNYNEIHNFKEIVGKGIKGILNNQIYKIGSSKWALKEPVTSSVNRTEVYVSINGQMKGKFILSNYYRYGLKSLINHLKPYRISLLSGDNESEKEKLHQFFDISSKLLFNQTPEDKILYIQDLQHNGNKVLMIGDGLNDAGALQQSDLGIAISEDVNGFTPASDVILDGKNFHLLYDFLQLSKKSVCIVWICFAISFFYNILGLSFAISGNLNPFVAAILMPISSITVVLFTSVSTWWITRKYL